MLTGNRLFERETVSDVLAAFCARTSNWRAIPSSVPADVRRLRVRCLDREPKNRLYVGCILEPVKTSVLWVTARR